MREFILWYNRNKKGIFKIIGIVLAVIIGIQLFQWIVVRYQQRNQNNIPIAGNNEQQNLEDIELNTDKSTVTGQILSEQQNETLEIIDKFVQYCNNKQISDAYNLLSEECKKEMFPTLKQFQEKYYAPLFGGKVKNVAVENWVRDIYKVKITDDALSTGIYNPESARQDYITIIEDKENNYKLNINGYIGKEEIDKSNEVFDVKIQVLEKHQYMDFETYVFEVTNSSTNLVLLNDISDTDSMYLQDRNEMKYYAYMHELSEANLKLYPGEKKKITIKYYSKYNSTKRIDKIVFSKIALGGDEIAEVKINL